MKQPRVERTVRQPAIRAAVVIGQDGLAAEQIANRGHAVCDQRQRVIPAYAAKLARTLGAVSHGRIQEPIGAVNMVRKAAHFAANVTGRCRTGVVAVERNHAAVLNLDVQAARVGTIQRTSAGDGINVLRGNSLFSDGHQNSIGKRALAAPP